MSISAGTSLTPVIVFLLEEQIAYRRPIYKALHFFAGKFFILTPYAGIMECILCGKELDGDYQICRECAIKSLDVTPLWHCRDFLIGDSVPDVLSKKSLIVLSLGHEREAFVDVKTLKNDLKMPESPIKEDAQKMFWKANMYLQHMEVPLYMEDVRDMELTIKDIDNLSYIMRSVKELHDYISEADEELLSRLAALYFHSLLCLNYLRGISPEDKESMEEEIGEDMSFYLSEGEKIMPHRGHIVMNQAFLAILNGKYRQALDLYRMVPEHDSNPRALTGMGMAYVGLEMPESADESYTRALRENDDWAPAWKGKAYVALKDKRWGAAIQFITRALNLRPDIAELHILKGDIFAEQGLHSEAEHSYKKATELRFGESAWLKRAEAMHNAGRMGAALQFVERYLFYFPEDKNGLWWRERIKQSVEESKESRY